MAPRVTGSASRGAVLLPGEHPPKRARSAASKKAEPTLEIKAQSFNELVNQIEVAPAQSIWNKTKYERLCKLADAVNKMPDVFPVLSKTMSPENLEQERVERGKKRWPVDTLMSKGMSQELFTAVKNGLLPLCAIGFHVIENVVPEDTEADILKACAPLDNKTKSGTFGGWESNSHGQRRQVWTHGLTLLDREKLNPAVCQTQRFPDVVVSKIMPRIRKEVEKKLGIDALPEEFDFLYVNRYRKAKKAFIRFHHDNLTQMGPVVVGISLVANATLSLVATVNRDGKTAGGNGIIDIPLPRGSMYIMSGLSRYSYKHGSLDASENGDRVSLTFRTVVRKKKDAKNWKREPRELKHSSKNIQFPVGYTV